MTVVAWLHDGQGNYQRMSSKVLLTNPLSTCLVLWLYL